MKSLYTQIQAKSSYLREPDLRWKIECILDGLRGNVRWVCKRYGIDHSTFYRWRNRLQENGCDPQSLRPRSRRPHRSPRLLDEMRQEEILGYRKTFQYGEDTIAYYMTEKGLPVSPHGVRNVLHRADVPFRRRREKKPHRHVKRYNLDRPGQGLQLDIKYVPFPVEDKRTYVFNAIDDCSRWRFQYAYRHKGEEEACDFIQRLWEAAPFPIERIQTDNDICFTDRFVRKPQSRNVHPFPALLASKNIRHKLIPPGVKELNGKVERSHKTDDMEFYWRLPLWLTFEQCQDQLRRWTFEYNHYRPHGSLKMKTPVQRLAKFGFFPKDPAAGFWNDPKKPTHYNVVTENLKKHRKDYPDKPLIHWTFKPKGPQTRSNPKWQTDAPSAIRDLSHIYGRSTPLLFY